MFASKDALFAKSSSGYRISRSLRIRGNPTNAYLSRTPASASNRQTWTWSAWVKRGSLGSPGYIFTGVSGTSETDISFSSNNTIYFLVYNSGATAGQITTSAVFRDTSAWYHVVVVLDSTNATGTDRMRIYVNGVRQAVDGTSVVPALSTSGMVNNNVPHYSGTYNGSIYPFDGYLAEVNFIDSPILVGSTNGTTTITLTSGTTSGLQVGWNVGGTNIPAGAYITSITSSTQFVISSAATGTGSSLNFGATPPVSSFGAFDTNGVWQPKAYAGSYGTNGFYLPFTDNSSATALGYDKRPTIDYGTLTGTNGAALTTSVVKYGDAALALGSASNRYVLASPSTNHNIYNKNFTIEFWWKGQASDFNFGSIDGVLTGYNYLLGKGRLNTASYGWGVRVYSTGGIALDEFFGSGGTSVFTSGISIFDNAWHHIAITRSGSTTTIYIDGVSRGTGTLNSNTDNSYGLSINGMYDYTNGTSVSYYGGGTMDDLRFYSGVTKYTGTFTPPTAALPIGYSDAYWNNVVLAMPMDGTNGATTIPFYIPNNWAPSGISVATGTTYDSMIDSPTNYADGGNWRGNYAVLNPLDVNVSNTQRPTDGNLTYPVSGAFQYSARSTIFVTSGKWYAEFTISSSAAIVAVVNSSAILLGYNGANGVFTSTTAIYNNPSAVQTGLPAFAANDVIGVAFDADANTVQFYKNGSTYGTAVTISTFSGPYTFQTGANGATCTINANFGQQPFRGMYVSGSGSSFVGTGAPPSGFLALNTQNLPTPTIAAGNKHFDISLYTGTSATQNVTNSGSFQPDFAWFKTRSNTGTPPNGSNQTFNSLTPYEVLYTDATNAAFNPGTAWFTFANNGVSLTSSTQLNNNTTPFVLWQWKAGGTGVSNTSGTITSTVSANTSAGFSVVTYAGNLTAAGNSTIGHGLGVAPSLVITKARNTTSRWAVQHISLGANEYLQLNDPAAVRNSSTDGAGTLPKPTSTVFYGSWLLGLNISGDTFVAYCFAPVAGYSAFGSYTGNGSPDGPFVYLGFRPRWVLIKSTVAAEGWNIFDTARDTYNPELSLLFPNTSVVEFNNGSTWADVTSNGFKIRYNTAPFNTSGGNYIYAAFAENPFKTSRAR